MRLDGKVALVTGAASGIGGACARRFAEEGATVVGIDLQGADHRADVRDEAGVQDAVAAVVGEHGGIDILVNAAGVAGGGPVHLLDKEEWDRVIDVNLTGTFLVSKAVLAQSMFERQGGSIIHLASIEGLWGGDVLSAYNASKGGVVLLTKQMAIDYGRLGIRVNCLCPGFIETPMTEMVRTDGMETYRDRIGAQHMLGRWGRADEVAAAAAFLASDDASFITGHALAVDGGFTAGVRFGLGEALGL